MGLSLETDVAFLHIAGGAARITPPPGTLAQTAPRRVARGRSQDMLFLNIGLDAPQSASPSFIDHMARLAADAYYGTPGSVTSALRESAAVINDHLVDMNQGEDGSKQHHGRLMAGVLRENDLYLAQCGSGQAILIRPGQVTRLISEEAAKRPLGLSLAPQVHYHHLEVQTGDLLILTTFPPPLWSDTTLSGLSALDPMQAIDRLVAASSHDLTGIMARFIAHGERPALMEMDPSSHADVVEQQPPQQPDSQVRRKPAEPRRVSERPRGSEAISRARTKVRSWTTSIIMAASNIVGRMAPGLAEPPSPSAISSRMLVATAVAVPLIVVAIAAAVYFGRGRSQQFDTYVLEAAAAIQVAQMKTDPEQARVDWDAALRFLDKAETYGTSDEATAMRQLVQETLDTLDLVVRLDFRSVVSGGFSPNALITSLAASATDLYVFDSVNQVMWHSWGAPERGQQIDSAFECLNGPDSYPELDVLVDIVIQAEPGALGAEGVVGVDADGSLIYCAPERQPALAQLTQPDLGWGRIQAIDVFNETLYVLDVGTNAVWIYNAVGGLFSGTPELFFVEEVRDLGGALDLAMAGDELFILYADGRLDRCRRFPEAERIRVECDQDAKFQDDRPGHEASAQIPGAIAAEMSYSPPPEPSLFFLDTFSNSIYHYSLRLVYQGRYTPLQPFIEEITTLALGPPNDLYLAVGAHVYHAQPTR
jgi:hypothetical protein